MSKEFDKYASGHHKGTAYELTELDGKVTLRRASPFTGQPSVRHNLASFERLHEYFLGKTPLIQNAFPELSADEREFIMTGITEDEWPSA